MTNLFSINETHYCNVSMEPQTQQTDTKNTINLSLCTVSDWICALIA